MTSEFGNFFRQAADEYLQAYIDMATRLDAEWIVVHAGFHFTNYRYHESLNNVTPADTYFGRDAVIIQRREKIKKLTIQKRRLNHQRKAA